MTSENEYECINCGHEGINTRATPSADTLAGVQSHEEVTYEDNVDTAFRTGAGTLIEKLSDQASIPSPDSLAGLVRCDVGDNHICIHAEGEYVRYSEATAVIAELKRRNREIELEHTGVRNSYYDERRKVVTLEAELAQLKTQEPIDQTAEIDRLREAMTAALLTMQRYERMGYGDDVYMADLWASIRKAEDALSGKEPS